MSANTELVDRFIGEWKSKDVDSIMRYFAEDAVYINVPIVQPNIGTPAIRAVIEMFVGMATEVEFIVHRSAEDPANGVVMNERTDRFQINGKWLELPVMGVFEIVEGKIRAWRDYFDLGTWQRAMDP